MKRWMLGVVGLAALFVAPGLVPFLAGSAAGATQNVTVVASGFAFHLGSASGQSPPRIAVVAGDSLAFRIENRDATFHTFTVPHFGIDRGLDNGSASNPTVIFVNITTSSSDVGTWQFWCRPHSTGTDPNDHTGMVGTIVVEPAASVTTIVAATFEFHLGSATGTAPASITVTAGDSLRLRVENQDNDFHTFTVPHWGIDEPLDNGSASNPTVVFVNITTTASDVGTWQFWCRPHSTGTDPNNHAGMVGTIVVQSTTPPNPPRSPGFEALAVIGALAVAFVAVAVWRRRR